jgi:hypothetical protein
MLLILNACRNSVQEDQYDNKEMEEIPDFINSTAYDFPEFKIPNAYYMDSLSVYDSITRSNYSVFFIQSKDSSQHQLNDSIRRTIDERITIDKSFLDSNNMGSLNEYSYYARPIKCYSNQQIISITHMIDTYTDGGNHHNYDTRTFSYDLFKNKIIGFNDVFSIQSKQDSIEFISYLEQHVIEGCSDAWEWPYSYIDFSFCSEGITINPNLSWACSGTLSILPVDSTNRFIRNKWIK